MIMLIVLSFLECILSKSKKYHRDNSKKNYEIDKIIHKLYRDPDQTNLGETYTQFKKRVKKNLG